jgi:hypothetical protein
MVEADQTRDQGDGLMNIDAMGLSVRAANALRAEGVVTVDELTQHTERTLLRIPNLGYLALGDIKQTLARHGLCLTPGPRATESAQLRKLAKMPAQERKARRQSRALRKALIAAVRRAYIEDAAQAAYERCMKNYESGMLEGAGHRRRSYLRWEDLSEPWKDHWCDVARAAVDTWFLAQLSPNAWRQQVDASAPTHGLLAGVCSHDTR